MSKKKEEIENNPPVKEENKVEETPVKKRDNVRGRKGKELDILYNLVNGLSGDDVLTKLMATDYYHQYLQELEYHRKGYEVTPYVDVDEFYKAMKIKR